MSSMGFLNLGPGSSSADWINSHVEHHWWSRSSGWIGNLWSGSIVAFADSPTAEQDEQADQGHSDHRAGGGEDPVVERDFLGQLLGLLGHGLQFMEQNLGVKFAQNIVPELGDCSGDHLAIGLLEELS